MKTDANPILKDFSDRPKIYEIPFLGNIRAAGDSFIGGFCASLCEGKHIDDAVYYIYHGDCDESVPVSNSIEMLTSINKRGGNTKIKILYGVKHDAWNAAYSDDELIDWMLQQKKKDG